MSGERPYKRFPPDPPSNRHMLAGLLVLAAVFIGAILDRVMS